MPEKTHTSATITSQSRPWLKPWGFPLTPTCSPQRTNYLMNPQHVNFFSIKKSNNLSFPPNEMSPTAAHQAVFLPMVQPMTCTACPNDALQLICLHPDNFIYPFITVGHKKENQSLIRLSQFEQYHLQRQGIKRNTLEEQDTLSQLQQLHIYFLSKQRNDCYLPPEIQTFSTQLHGPRNKG